MRGPGLIPRHLQSGCPPDVPLRVGSPLSLAAQPPLPSLLPGLPWDYSQGCGARRRLPACSQERRSHWGGGCHLTQRVACWVFRQVRCQRGVQEPPGLTAPAFVRRPLGRGLRLLQAPPSALTAHCVPQPGLPLIFLAGRSALTSATPVPLGLSRRHRWGNTQLSRKVRSRASPGVVGGRSVRRAPRATPVLLSLHSGPSLLGKPLRLSTWAMLEERCLSARAWARTPKHCVGETP